MCLYPATSSGYDGVSAEAARNHRKSQCRLTSKLQRDWRKTYIYEKFLFTLNLSLCLFYKLFFKKILKIKYLRTCTPPAARKFQDFENLLYVGLSSEQH